MPIRHLLHPAHPKQYTTKLPSSSIKMYHDKAIARQAVLAGWLEEPKETWMRPSWEISVFISSTFTDTHRERDFIMKMVMPTLRKRARQFGRHRNHICRHAMGCSR
jgi:hypothetical protein